jgi:hypothetical protein
MALSVTVQGFPTLLRELWHNANESPDSTRCEQHFEQFEGLTWKRCESVKMVQRILEDPHWVERGDLGDHQIRIAPKNGEKVS